jgi:hypothetical protein
MDNSPFRLWGDPSVHQQMDASRSKKQLERRVTANYAAERRYFGGSSGVETVEVTGWSSPSGLAEVTASGAVVSVGAGTAHAICAQGNSHPKQPSNAMATGPSRSQMAINTSPTIRRFLIAHSA